MKRIATLRKTGNSTAFNFSKADLAVSGFAPGQHLSIIVRKGEIRITSAESVLIEFTEEEATALLHAASTTDTAVAARAKIKAQMIKFNHIKDE